MTKGGGPFGHIEDIVSDGQYLCIMYVHFMYIICT